MFSWQSKVCCNEGRIRYLTSQGAVAIGQAFTWGLVFFLPVVRLSRQGDVSPLTNPATVPRLFR